jgi:hypothetical protein
MRLLAYQWESVKTTKLRKVVWDDARDLIGHLLSEDVTERPQTWGEVMSHPFLRRVDEGVPPSPPPRGQIINGPGHWDAMISYTQRNTEAKLLAAELYSSLRERGKTVWLDVKMDILNEGAMKEAAQRSRCIIAVVTGVERDGDPEENAYFKRPFCINELRWARAAGVPIQPVIRPEDKTRIGELLALAPDDLQDLGKLADFIHLDRSRKEFWAVGVDVVLANMERLNPRAGMTRTVSTGHGVALTAPEPEPEPKQEPETERYDFCFSYASKGNARVEEAKSRLEAKKWRVFWGLDVKTMAAKDWRNQWMAACQRSDVCVNFLSVAYVQSQACADEWNYAKKNKDPSTVLNVVVGGRQEREAILKVPLDRLASNGGAGIQMHFTSDGQALSVYEADDIVAMMERELAR